MNSNTTNENGSKVEFPKGLTPIIIIVSWMTYRILGFLFLPEVVGLGGNMMPPAWIIPLGQDGLVGLTAPIIAYLIVTRPKVLTYTIAVGWVWWGIVDFIIGMITESFYPPMVSPFGPHTPNIMMTIWLFGNLIIEIYALYLLLTPTIRNYFIASDKLTPLPLASSPMKGRWIWIVIGSGLMGVFFPVMTKVIDKIFQMIGM